MRIAVIPARAGSKRIPGKNIRKFLGKPIIVHSINTALNSKLFDKVLVSTDSLEVADIAREHGALTPFLRSKKISDDYAGIDRVMAHAVQWMVDAKWKIEATCCIYATAPFLRTDDLKIGLKLFKSGNWDYSCGVLAYAHPIQRALRKKQHGKVSLMRKEHYHTRTQDLEIAYHDAGQYYWGKPDAWLKQRPIFMSETIVQVMPSWRVNDIDTEEDWRRSELIANIIMKETFNE